MRKDISILAMLYRIGQRVRRLKEQEYFYIYTRLLMWGCQKIAIDNRRIINLTLPEFPLGALNKARGYTTKMNTTRLVR